MEDYQALNRDHQDDALSGVTEGTTSPCPAMGPDDAAAQGAATPAGVPDAGKAESCGHADSSAAGDSGLPPQDTETTGAEEAEIPYAKHRWIVLAIGLVLIALGAYLLIKSMNGTSVLVSSDASRDASKAVSEVPVPSGDAFPSMGVFTVDGPDGKLTIPDFSGTPAIIHFFDDTDLSTLEGLASMDAAFQAYGDSVRFIPVFIGERSRAETMFTSEGLTLPLYTDTQGDSIAACGITTMPATFFVDGDGFITASASEPIGEDSLAFGISLLVPSLQQTEE